VGPLLANIYLARLDGALGADGVSFVRYADDVRLASRTEAGAKDALKRTGEVLQGLGLRLSERKKLVTLSQGVDFLGYRLVSRIAAVASLLSSVEEQAWFSWKEPAPFFVIAGAHVPVHPSTDPLAALRFMSAS